MTPGPIAINSATFCRNQDRRNARCTCCDSRMYPALLHHCDHYCISVYEIPKSGHPAGNSWDASSRRRCTDCLCSIRILITAFFGDSGIKLSSCNPKAVVIFAGCLILLRKRVNPVLVMVLAGIVNVGLSLFI